MRWFRGMAMVLVGIMLLTIFGSAFAAVKDDTVSPLYLYTRKVTSTKKNVFRTYCDGKYTSGEYFYKTTTGTWMYYTSDVAAEKTVYLKGRPDSSVSSCTVTGKFGAG